MHMYVYTFALYTFTLAIHGSSLTYLQLSNVHPFPLFIIC